MAKAAPLFSEEAFGRYDELREPSGTVRPHWEQLAASFAAMAPDEYERRNDSALRMVRENGVTYNVYDEAPGLGRLWQLDIAPFIINADDWTLIEAAVTQRARLANAILHDIYGDGRLVREGVVPAQLVLGHPQYLRALAGVRPLDGVHVHLFSIDLARATDGSWIVHGSRADAPTGLGYALENRVVVSQTFPELFSELGVHHLAAFFRHYRDAVVNLARGGGGQAVLLTPGAYNEAYFEHAYLARYLGLQLVEGDDLSVRDGVVYLRTLGGLERVSVIFRRLDSDFADPLELRADSALGVPGLVDVIRTGNVVMANALGGGVVESPALDAYLPNASRALFGEELLLSNIPTIWCGTAWGRAEGVVRVRRGIVRNAFDAAPLFSRGSSARFGSDMSAEDVARFADEIERRGATQVVADLVPLGTAPTFEGGAFTSRPMSLRVFAAWTPNGYVVMPGGLARVAADDTVRAALSMQSGAASKDVWALAPGPVDTFSLLRPPTVRMEIRRSGNEAPSRAMDNLLWLGRYAERTEGLVRVLRAVVLRLAGDTGSTTAMNAVAVARRLLLPLKNVTEEALAEATAGDDARLRVEVEETIFDKECAGLQRLLRRVARTAWIARDRLSLDTWRVIYSLTSADTLESVGAFDGTGALAYLDMLVRRTAALSGLADENMTRGNNWLFFDLGRRIERALATGWLVRHTLAVADARESGALQLALELADSGMTYSYRYRSAFQAAPALDLLLLDASNPRAVAFQTEAIVRHAIDLPMATDMQRRGRVKALAQDVHAAVTSAEAYPLAELNGSRERPLLSALLDDVEIGMKLIADAVGDDYLHHLGRFPA
jgi:uncharacterized circularly permuted ATP-grasp superfamily protein/uncharacterized alpha-E superfamily protein